MALSPGFLVVAWGQWETDAPGVGSINLRDQLAQEDTASLDVVKAEATMPGRGITLECEAKGDELHIRIPEASWPAERGTWNAAVSLVGPMDSPLPDKVN